MTSRDPAVNVGVWKPLEDSGRRIFPNPPSPSEGGVRLVHSAGEVEETEGLSLTISVYACAGIVGIWNVKMWGGALRFLPLVDIGIPLKSYLISVVSNKQSQRIRASNLHTSYFIVNFFVSKQQVHTAGAPIEIPSTSTSISQKKIQNEAGFPGAESRGESGRHQRSIGMKRPRNAGKTETRSTLRWSATK